MGTDKRTKEMIYKPMDDTDIEEKLLLNALNNPHQALNLPMTYDNYSRNNYYNNHYDTNKHHRRKSSYPKFYGEANKYSADRRDRQYDSFWQQNNSTRTSETVSMSTEEELLDDFDLDFDKPEQENKHHQGNNNARFESTIHKPEEGFTASASFSFSFLSFFPSEEVFGDFTCSS